MTSSPTRASSARTDRRTIRSITGRYTFVVLDDVIWHGKTEEEKGHYTAGLGARQLEFVRNDLKLLPREQLVVLTMHIPIIEVEEQERAELYRLLAEHPHNVSFSGHWHVHAHWFIGQEDGWPGEKPHEHISFVATCGSWWHGARDEVGIPHTTMRDGAPNGWCVATFDGHEYSVTFRAARRPAEYQMNIFTPEVVAAVQVPETEVVVNVFAGSKRSTVEMRVGAGPWIGLEWVEREDPYYQATVKTEEGDSPQGRSKLPKPIKSPHIWRGYLPVGLTAGTHLIEVRATDVYGQTHFGRRIIRVE